MLIFAFIHWGAIYAVVVLLCAHQTHNAQTSSPTPHPPPPRVFAKYAWMTHTHTLTITAIRTIIVVIVEADVPITWQLTELWSAKVTYSTAVSRRVVCVCPHVIATPRTFYMYKGRPRAFQTKWHLPNSFVQTDNNVFFSLLLLVLLFVSRNLSWTMETTHTHTHTHTLIIYTCSSKRRAVRWSWYFHIWNPYVLFFLGANCVPIYIYIYIWYDMRHARTDLGWPELTGNLNFLFYQRKLLTDDQENPKKKKYNY